jgi:hypothetical protein
MALGGFWKERALEHGIAANHAEQRAGTRVLRIKVSSPAEHLGVQALCIAAGVNWSSFNRTRGDNFIIDDRIFERFISVYRNPDNGQYEMIRGPLSDALPTKEITASDAAREPQKYIKWMMEVDEKFAYYIDLSWIKGEARNVIIDKILLKAISKGYPVGSMDTYHNQPCIALHQWDNTVTFNSSFIVNEWPEVTSKEISVNQAIRGEYKSA